MPLVILFALLFSGSTAWGDPPPRIPAGNLVVKACLVRLDSATAAEAGEEPVVSTGSIAEFLARWNPAQDSKGPGRKKKGKKSKSDAAEAVPTRPQILFKGEQSASLEPSGGVRFLARESRPAFALGPGGTNVWAARNLYGFELKADARLIPLGEGRRPVLAVGWEGNLDWSPLILQRWEKIAHSLFLAARSIPGAAYESMEADDDGFVNTTGSLNVRGLFGGGKKNNLEPAKTAPAPAGEPSYIDDTARRSVPLKGSLILQDRGLTVQRLESLDEVGKPVFLYLLLELRVES